MIQRALISVSDKRGVVTFARGLAELGVEIVSTGGTAAALRKAGIPVTPIELITQVPEMLGGRVKTLHPKIHGAILARRERPDDRDELDRHGIAPIDLVAVNLYPFARTVLREGVARDEAIENIDIGGVALLRAAAKNHRYVTVLSHPDDYPAALEALREQGEIPVDQRATLAARAFALTARYDGAIAAYLGGVSADPFPETLRLEVARADELRYGENPHQRAALYRHAGAGGLAAATQLHGKGMSSTNWLDAEAAWLALDPFDERAVVIVKHASPCGIATNSDPVAAWRDALASDPVSAFGGVIATNRPVDEPLAAAIDEIFSEIILAPAFTEGALALLREKANRRLLRVPPHGGDEIELRSIPGGFVAQERDRLEAPLRTEIVSARPPTDDERRALEFAWRALLMVKSNAIVLARLTEGGAATVGIGTGQPSRVDAVRIAARKAGERAVGSVMASDAFFPFADGVEVAAEAGVRAIIQPGGSRRDAEVVAAADRHDIAMVLTGTRHFRH